MAGRRRDAWLPGAGAEARRKQDRDGKRHGRRGEQDGNRRPLQRIDDELFRRNGG
ncbi:hypothetical protein D3C73_1658350 [compost metagenome]